MQNLNTNKNQQWKRIFLERLLKFSVAIIKLANKMPKSPAGFAIATQLIKSGTSVGANVEEAQDGSSLRDFIQKLNIALRESRESKYWLKVIDASGLLDSSEVKMEINECGEIIAILTSSVKSSKTKLI